MEFIRNIFKKHVHQLRPSQEPFIDITSGEMKRVYWLTQALQDDPKRVEVVRALTLNRKKPFLGLKGNRGLFASSEWWSNINNRVIPLKFVSGVIVRIYEAGQDKTGKPNTLQLSTDESRLVDVGIYLNNKTDIALFQLGYRVELVYALDELKNQPDHDGGIAYAEVALEMAVSVNAQSAA